MARDFGWRRIVNIEKLKNALEIAALLSGDDVAKAEGGRAVIVRSRDAGVVYGYLDRLDGSTVYLSKGRQMWSWTAAEGGTLIDCANHGVKDGKFSTMGGPVIVIGACAVIDVSQKAIASLESATWV